MYHIQLFKKHRETTKERLQFVVEILSQVYADQVGHAVRRLGAGHS